MTNYEYYFGTPERAARMEVRFSGRPIRVEVMSTEPTSLISVSSRPIRDFDGVRDYLSWLESEHDDGANFFWGR